MRSNKLFYFFLTDSAGRSAYWENNIVKWSSLPRPLEFAPEGWKEIQPQFQRSTKYFGINRSMTVPFKFVEDGASILRYLLYAVSSYETKLYLAVNKWNDETDTYDGYYSAEIDFTKITDDSATGVTVNLIEGNILKLLNANDETVYEIPCKGEFVQVDGLDLSINQPLSIIEYTTVSGSVGDVPIPTVLLTPEGTPVYIYFNENITADPDGYWLLEVDEAAPTAQTFTLHIETNIGTDANWATGRFRIYELTQPAGGVVTYTELLDASFTSQDEKIPFTFTQTYTLAPGTRLGFSFRAVFPLSGVTHTIFPGSGYVSSTARFVTTICPAIRPYDLWIALLQKIGADSRYNYVSNQLKQYEHLVVSCITAVRGLENPVIKTSLSEFFKAFNAILFSGFGVSGNTLIFESRQYFYNSSAVTLTLGETSGLQVSVAEDLLANTAKFGYPEQEIESLNGLFSFNNTNSYELPITKVQREYTAISPYLTDCYLIESKRINLKGKNTTDDRNDNSTVIFNTLQAATGFTGVSFRFDAPDKITLYNQAADVGSFAVDDGFIVTNTNIPTPAGVAALEIAYTVVSATAVGADLEIQVYQKPAGIAIAVFQGDISFPLKLRRENYTTLTGVPTPTVYNIEDLTPKRMLLKHSPYLRSLTYWQSLEYIKFLTADKNKDLVTELNGVTIIEKADYRVDKLGSPLFYPFIFTFKTKVPKTFVQLMYNAVNGHIQFNYQGFTFYGFPVQMSAKPDLNESQEWKVLASPLNNLQLLIDIVANPTNNLHMDRYGMSFSHLCPVQFVPQGRELLPPYNFRHMDFWTDAEQKGEYPAYASYPQPWQTSDQIRLQCITRDLGPVVVTLENKYGQVFGTYPLQQIYTAAVSAPYQLFDGTVDLQYITPGCYRLRAVAGLGSLSVTFLSEWINLCDEHRGTILFEYGQEKNKASTIFTAPGYSYRPTLRVKGSIVDFVPKLRSSSYEDQVADIQLLDSVAYRSFTLLIKTVSDWMIDKINNIMGLNDVDIDGKGFTREEDAQFELLTSVPGINKRAWTLEIREAENRDNISLTTDDVTNQQAVLINVDTTLFGDLASQVSSNPIQIEQLTNV